MWKEKGKEKGGGEVNVRPGKGRKVETEEWGNKKNGEKNDGKEKEEDAGRIGKRKK